MPRLVGVFAAENIVSPVTARSQLIGGMTMALSMALLDEAHLDPQFGEIPTHDLAQYHVGAIEAHWIDEHEPDLGDAAANGIGIGIVGTAAAIANAVHDATGLRIRDRPSQFARPRSTGLCCCRSVRTSGASYLHRRWCCPPTSPTLAAGF